MFLHVGKEKKNKPENSQRKIQNINRDKDGKLGIFFPWLKSHASV